jgi:hypothetical protein
MGLWVSEEARVGSVKSEEGTGQTEEKRRSIE